MSRARVESPVQPVTVRARAGLVRLLAYAGVGAISWFAFLKDYKRAAATAVALALLGQYQRGPTHSFLWTLFNLGAPPRIVYSGDGVAPGYEDVERAFKRNFEDGIELGSQCVAYVGGRRVVDLCGARTDVECVRHYNTETRQNVFSSSKCLTSLAVAMLVDRGHLKYEQTVASIWPEFAQFGKDRITVAELMRHEAGLGSFDRSLVAAELTAERVRAGSVSAIIASQKPKWDKNSRRRYHALTRGWIINEVFVRADPRGRTVGEFLRDEIAAPLGLDNQFAIGLKNFDNIAPMKSVPRLWMWWHCLVPWFLGSKLRTSVLGPFFFMIMGWGEKVKPLTLANNQKMPGGRDMWNHREIQAAEIPSANGHASARAIARITACVVANSQGQAFEGVTLLSKEGADKAHGNPVVLPMFMSPSKFTNAGWNIFEKPDGLMDVQGAVGWMGWGGSVMQWHRGLQVGFGYAPNLMSEEPDNRLGFDLHRAVLKCAMNLQANPESR